MATTTRFLCIALACIAVGLVHCATATAGCDATEHCPEQAASYVFNQYQPSIWERQWVSNTSKWSGSVCAVLKRQSRMSAKWLKATTDYGFSNAEPDFHSAKEQFSDNDVFSRFIYMDTESVGTIEVYVEPLVGLLRHPYAPAEVCMPMRHAPKVATQDRSYLLLNAMPPEHFQAMYPGKKILIDLGTREFSSSLGWLTTHYGKFGIEFDQVYAWEKAAMDPAKYWGHVSDAYVSRLHFFNIPVHDDASKPDHPFNILRRLYCPGDYVAIKLDIDYAPLELALMKQIEQSPDLVAMIGDLFFELHHDAPEMEPYFHETGTTPYAEAMATFSAFRAMGVRLHGWP